MVPAVALKVAPPVRVTPARERIAPPLAASASVRPPMLSAPRERTGVPLVTGAPSMALSARIWNGLLNDVFVSARSRSVPPLRAMGALWAPTPSASAWRNSAAPPTISSVPVKFGFAAPRMRSPAPVFTSRLAVLDVASRSEAALIVSAWPAAISIVPVSPAATEKRRPAPAVKPETTRRVPPLYATSLPVAPRWASAPISIVPSLMKMPPLKVFAPERESVPAPALTIEMLPSPALP